MSIQRFVSGLRRARDLYEHRVHGDGVPAWLSPFALDGFNPREFSHLPRGDLDRLATGIGRFRAVAERADADRVVSPEALAEAEDAFQQVMSSLPAYLTTTNEAAEIRRVLQAVPFPEAVATWEYKLGTDWSDDPAVWVWVIVNDAAAEQPDFMSEAERIGDQIRSTLDAAGVERIPYVRFRTVTEERELQPYAP